MWSEILKWIKRGKKVKLKQGDDNEIILKTQLYRKKTF